LSTGTVGRLIRGAGVHGGVKFYRGAARAARLYVARDRSRADDYYLAEGQGVAQQMIVTSDGVEATRAMTGETYERWVAGFDVDLGTAKGRLREDGLRFVEVVVDGPKTGPWPPPWTRRSRRRLMGRKALQRTRSSVGSPSMRRRGWVRGGGRSRFRSSESRRR